MTTTSTTTPATEPEPDIVRLMRLLRRNGELLRQLRPAAARLARALDYQAGPAAAPLLAGCLVDHATRRYESILAEIRANRAEADEIMRAPAEVEAA